MKISVIIPCYNVEAYLRECIDSLVTQTIGLEHLELIFVDDCSTDNTVSVLQEYEKQYPEQIMLIACEQNGRQGTARNIGLQYATGDFISFVDSDDWIHRDTFRYLIALANAGNADLVQFRYSARTSDIPSSPFIENPDARLYDFTLPGKRKSFVVNSSVLNCSCTTKLYRRTLLEQAQTAFAEGVCYEEPLFTYPLRFYVDRVVVTETPLYFYRTNENGTTLKTMTDATAIRDHLNVQLDTYSFMRETPFYTQYKNEIDLFFIHSFFCEPFCFSKKRHQLISPELCESMTAILEELLPDWKNNPYLSSLEDAEEQFLLDLLETSSDWRKSMIDLYFSSGTNNYALLRLQAHLDKIMAGINNGDINAGQEIPANYTYKDLQSVFLLTQTFPDCEAAYVQIYRLIMESGKNRIHRLLERNRKIRVAFFSISAAEWPTANLFFKLRENPLLEVSVIPLPLMDRDYESRRDTYTQTLRFFQENGYAPKVVYDADADLVKGWTSTEEIPDIFVYTTSWYEAFPAPYQITALPLSSLCIHVPYGLDISESPVPGYAQKYMFNKDIINLTWRTYTDSRTSLSEYEHLELLKGENIRASGYSKMDYFYSPPSCSEKELRALWSIPEDYSVSEIKKVILAPHYSISPDCALTYSTFAQNKDLWPELAKKYEGRVSFVLKPHPNLRLHAVQSGLFPSYEAYDRYLEEWKKLPNTNLIQEGDYLRLFATSDGMIMDSASFVGEYLYADKPLLFLTKENQSTFNALGKNLLSAYDSCDGADFASIERFVEEVILGGMDSMGTMRKEIFQNEMDYFTQNGMLSTDFIYRDFCDNLLQ